MHLCLFCTYTVHTVYECVSHLVILLTITKMNSEFSVSVHLLVRCSNSNLFQQVFFVC